MNLPQSLPNELLHILFSNLGNQLSLGRCASVCRKWSKVAQPLLLAAPEFKNAMQFDSWLVCMEESGVSGGRCVGRSVKELTVVSVPHHWDFMQKDVLRRTIQSCPNITLLDLEGCVYLNDESILNIAPVLPSLTHLSLSHCINITDTGILHIATHFTPLRIIELAGLFQVSTHSLHPLIKTHCQTLESLDLAGTRVTDANIRLALSDCKHLKHLDISSCYAIENEDALVAEAKERGVEVVVDSLPQGPEDWVDDDVFDGEWSDGEPELDDDVYEWEHDASPEVDGDDDDFDEDYEYGLED
ncbi:hypothetical protein HK097_010272 [Rhizophlyctis rosea]|uniref:F-box domain-containing protein n=1 Tax=Rhizophlyctis rosea TaxID=64517 RepID=A0AAD5S7U6_9FUNG|nr:hypothetical protein HK097_010272 [Rhizophlyctis rosea]